MSLVFADAVFWIALINPRDQWRSAAIAASRNLGSGRLITTDDVLAETLNYFAESGEHYRRMVCRQIEDILLDREIEIVDASHVQFLDGFQLYSNRPDKGYSLTDCISMNICRERGISHILTHDDHFRQEGFTVLL